MTEHMKGLEYEISTAIHDLGIPAHIKGYRYLREAVMLSLEKTEHEHGLYSAVAKKYETTVCGVERAIRHAIEVAWQRGNTETRSRYFVCTKADVGRKPSNTEFISAIAGKIAKSRCKTAI